MTCQIRPLTVEDYEAVRQLWETTPGVGLDESDERAGIELYLERNRDLSMVAVDQQRIVAAVLCGHDGRRGYLSHLAVDPAFRQNGLGRQLVARCLEQLADLGLQKCNLRIYVDNEAGIGFWRRLGWTLRDDVLVMTTYTRRTEQPRDPRGSYREVAARLPRTSTTLPMFQVDAFAERAFQGNPAAVCLMSEPADDAWLQHVAAEMNLSETAFVWRAEKHVGVPRFRLRWFTPLVEVDLCGHATLAAAQVLFEQGWVAAGDAIQFETRSGTLRAVRRGEQIELDFPAVPVSACPPPAGLLAALGAEPRFVGRNQFDWFVELDSADTLRSLTPDFAALRRIDARGILVTSLADSPGPAADFLSRFFAPACGIDEDPVTGSAHCCLGPYWRERLGRDALVGYQASRRGGTVHVRMVGDRVILGGRAVTVLSGKLQVPV